MDTLLSELRASQNPSTSNEPDRIVILPKPGYCVKLKTVENAKLFINVCMSDKVPAPEEISEVSLTSMLEDIDSAPPYRVPLSIGESHSVSDNSGIPCEAYDVIVNPFFLKKTEQSEIFKGFLMSVIIEGLENKFKLTIKRDWIILRNKKFIGTLQEQFIRTKARPSIIEMNTQDIPLNKEYAPNEIIIPSSPKVFASIPIFDMVAIPENDNPEYLSGQFKLPELNSARSVELRVGNSLLYLKTRNGLYEFAAELAIPVDEAGTVAEFNRDTKVLTVTMPVLKQPVALPAC